MFVFPFNFGLFDILYYFISFYDIILWYVILFRLCIIIHGVFSYWFVLFVLFCSILECVVVFFCVILYHFVVSFILLCCMYVVELSCVVWYWFTSFNVLYVSLWRIVVIFVLLCIVMYDMYCFIHLLFNFCYVFVI